MHTQTTFWSRRRFMEALAVVTAAAAMPQILVPLARADGDSGAPGSLDLPDTDRAKAVRAWMLGGKAMRAAAEYALSGTDADIITFLTTELPVATAEDNRVAVFSYLANGGQGIRAAASAALSGGDSAISAFVEAGYAPAVSDDLRVAVRRLVDETGPLRSQLVPAEAQRRGALAADHRPRDLVPGCALLPLELERSPEHLSVERARETAVAREDE